MTSRGNIDANLTVVDMNVLISPTPVPVVADSGDGIVERQVPHGELLVT
jgi:hypothetical protein